LLLTFHIWSVITSRVKQIDCVYYVNPFIKYWLSLCNNYNFSKVTRNDITCLQLLFKPRYKATSETATRRMPLYHSLHNSDSNYETLARYPRNILGEAVLWPSHTQHRLVIGLLGQHNVPFTKYLSMEISSWNRENCTLHFFRIRTFEILN